MEPVRISAGEARRLRERYGPWAVVTGASDGIGRAIAARLAAAGVHLVLVARRRAVLEALAASLREAHGIEARVVAVDLGRPGAAATLDAETADLDVGLLVAAAGYGTSGRFLEASAEAERDLLAVNCGAVLDATMVFARRFAGRGRGGIVLLGSLVGLQGCPFAAHYAATKAYVQALAEGLRLELASSGVDVVSSAPGPVHSGFAARAGMRMGAAVRPETVARETLAALGRRTTAVPGLLSKVLTYSLAPLPRPLRARILGTVMRGMTKHREATDRPAARQPA